MITPFKITDLENFEPNEFSRPDDLRGFLLDENWKKFTLWVQDQVKCIICFIEQEKGSYAAFFLMAKDFNAFWARRLRNYIHEKAEEFSAKRLVSLSVDCMMLDKWHEFLGFTTKNEKYMNIHGKDYNLWEVQWAGKQ